MISVQLLPGAIYNMMATVADKGYLTLADRYGLMAAILDESLSEDEQRSLNRLLRSVVRGRVKIVEELSEVL